MSTRDHKRQRRTATRIRRTGQTRTKQESHEAVVDGMLGEFDGIVAVHFGMGVLAPAVADDQDKGTVGE